MAVVAGASGSVATDVLAPFEVFARSGSFSASVVAATREPVVLSGGVHLVPDATFTDPGLRPDVVVVPAVTDPTGRREAPLRAWVAAQAARGAVILGVCAGSELLAASGVLEGRRATSHWSLIERLGRTYGGTDWRPGVRYVEDDDIITTAGVTSGVAGALRVVERLAGPAEAARVGDAVAYPGWTGIGPDTLPQSRWTWADLPFALNTAFPWFRPTTGLAVSDGVSETDLAAAADLYNGASFVTRTVLIGARSTVVTRHGLVLLTAATGAGIPHLIGSSPPALGSWRTSIRRCDGGPRTGGCRWCCRAAPPACSPTTPSWLTWLGPRTWRRRSPRPSTPSTRRTQLALTGPAWPWRATTLGGDHAGRLRAARRPVGGPDCGVGSPLP